MAESGFLNPLLCLCCTIGGAALFLKRSSPLGLVILAPLVIIIFDLSPDFEVSLELD
jgi:hypothetical protein